MKSALDKITTRFNSLPHPLQRTACFVAAMIFIYHAGRAIGEFAYYVTH